MAARPLSLVTYRDIASQRAHFAIFAASSNDLTVGTRIHVVGALMAGYRLEFERNHRPFQSKQRFEMIPIGGTSPDNVVDADGFVESSDAIPRDDLERVAAQLAPPRISENFLAPVNEVCRPEQVFERPKMGLLTDANQTTNRRCQEWTADYVRRLVELGFIEQNALDIIEHQRDLPTHGIGLQPAGRR